jgi:hypothetical protein
MAHYQHLDDRLKYLRNTKALPPGWSVHPLDYSDESYFTQESEPKAKFFYPVPFGAVPGHTDHLGHRLFCRTRKARLYIGEEIPYCIIHCSCRMLRTNDGTFCGFLQLNEAPTYSDRASDNPLEGTICELIAISEGLAPVSTLSSPILWTSGDPWTAESYEFYNVLWIEWEDGIAYRKALGKVKKDVWDVQAEDWIDVTLG